MQRDARRKASGMGQTGEVAAGHSRGLSPLPLNLGSKSVPVQVHRAAVCLLIYLFCVWHCLPTKATAEVQGSHNADSKSMSAQIICPL